MCEKVIVKIPATTANIGAGFDTFGMAFAFYSGVTMVKSGDFSGIKITNHGEITNSLADPSRNLVALCAKKLWDSVGFDYNGVELILDNDIPVSRGLGSSAAAIVGGFVAANELAGRPYDQKALLEMAVDVEGHPDNVAPAMLGGFVSSCRRDGETVVFKAVPPSDLKAVVAIPDFHLSTKVAREAMPQEVSVQDAVFNIQCASLLVGAMLSGNYDLLSKAVDDKLHQPYRFPLIKGADEVLAAARKAGALAAALSGAGPTLIAFTNGNGIAIRDAMEKAWNEQDVSCRVMVLEQDNEGVKVENA
ncbi:MAG: homoserine kinase [Bacillota bacterium]|jgi:homoserine kinase